MNVDESTVRLYQVCPELGEIDRRIERLRSRRNQLRDEILGLPREDRSRCGKRVELIAVMRELNDLRARRHSIVHQLTRDAEQ